MTPRVAPVNAMRSSLGQRFIVSGGPNSESASVKAKRNEEIKPKTELSPSPRCVRWPRIFKSHLRRQGVFQQNRYSATTLAIAGPKRSCRLAGLFRRSEGPLQKLRFEPVISFADSGSPPSTEPIRSVTHLVPVLHRKPRSRIAAWSSIVANLTPAPNSSLRVQKTFGVAPCSFPTTLNIHPIRNRDTPGAGAPFKLSPRDLRYGTGESPKGFRLGITPCHPKAGLL